MEKNKFLWTLILKSWTILWIVIIYVLINDYEKDTCVGHWNTVVGSTIFEHTIYQNV